MKAGVAIIALFASIAVTIDATVYFKEQFLDGGAVFSVTLAYSTFVLLSDHIVNVILPINIWVITYLRVLLRIYV